RCGPQVYGGMHRTYPLVAAVLLVAVSGCVSTRAPTTASDLEPAIRKKVERGIIEPGFTPEMVYLALGKPSEPTQSLVDATADGTWVYRDFNRTDNGIVRAGYQRRVVYDEKRNADVVVTEKIGPAASSDLADNSLHVTFRDGRVVTIQRVAAQ